MAKQSVILIADDEPTVREIVRRYLEKEGFRAIESANGLQTLDLLYQEKPDLLILDIMLPGVDGLTIMRALRDPKDSYYTPTNSQIPVILLTARTQENDRIHGLELGADDYVSKPFSPRELVLRVKAVLRRGLPEDPASIPHEAPIEHGDLYIEPSTRMVKVSGKAITLTAKEFDLLWFLVRHPRQVFTRTQLLDQIWGYEFFGDESTVTVHMHRLREKVEPDPANPSYIHTVWGVGYKFEVL
jgi:DNA-binding response OmpR family regulator